MTMKSGAFRPFSLGNALKRKFVKILTVVKRHIDRRLILVV